MDFYRIEYEVNSKQYVPDDFGAVKQTTSIHMIVTILVIIGNKNVGLVLFSSIERQQKFLETNNGDDTLH